MKGVNMMRCTVTVSVSEEINNRLNDIGDEMGITKSGVVNFLIRLGMKQYFAQYEEVNEDGNEQADR